MSDLLLLQEYHSLCEGGVCQDMLDENFKQDIKQNNAMYLTGIFQKANTKNANLRIYPRNTLFPEVNNYQRLIKEKRALGTLGHEDTAEISLDKVCQLVVKLWTEGNDVLGTLKVLNTPNGKILRTLVEDGVQIGISSRALGTLQESAEGNIVQSDLGLISFDIVQEPSTPQAFLSPTILKESREDIVRKVFTRPDRLFRLMGEILG